MLQTCDINIRDPFVLFDRDTYYLYGTRGPTCWGKADGFDVYTSKDLKAWEGPIVCFHNDGSFWADRNYWAPEVYAWRGAYYMFASFKAEGVQRGTAILKAESPVGPFHPHSDGTVTPKVWACLDGTFTTDGEGKPWMVFCHEWVQIGNGEVCAMPLTDDLRASAGEPVCLFRAHDAKWSKLIHHSSGMDGYVTDGPFFWRTASGRFECLWSSHSEDGYTLGVAVSRTGDLLGPYDQAEPLFRRDGGHGMVFRTREGRIMLALHTPNTHLEERPIFIPLTEKDGLLQPEANGSAALC